MGLTWIIGYHIKAGKGSQFTDYLRSENFKKLREELLKETGINIKETYFAVEPSSSEPDDFDAIDIWDLPNYAAIDKYIKSKARLKFFEEYLEPFVGSSYKWITTEKQEFLK